MGDQKNRCECQKQMKIKENGANKRDGKSKMAKSQRKEKSKGKMRGEIKMRNQQKKATVLDRRRAVNAPSSAVHAASTKQMRVKETGEKN